MISTMAIDRAQRRLNDFQKHCGEYGESALHLAYHAALPVALNAELLHLLRINFFLDPPEILPYTVEFEFLLSPLCREIDEGLYEIEPEIRDVLLTGLAQTYDAQRTRDIATLLWQYVEHHSPWADRVELERAQQVTALNFLAPEKAQQWLTTVATEVSRGQTAAREWFVAMQQEIENQTQQCQNDGGLGTLLNLLQHGNSNLRQRAVEALGRIGNDKAIAGLLAALQDESSKVRASAALTLGQAGNDKAISALIVTLQDADGNVRASAAQALGQIGNAQAMPALLEALKDKNRAVREMTAEALAGMGYNQAIDEFVNQTIDQLNDDPSQSLAGQDPPRQPIFTASLRSLSTSHEWTMQGEVMRIGTSSDNDVVLTEPGISRHHAEISCRYSTDDVTPPTCFLRDFSRYGTWISTSDTEEWQRIHQQEVAISTRTKLKFGGLQSALLEFSITSTEVLEQVKSGVREPKFTSTILWVDDRPTNNVYERQALEALGIRFVLVTNTENALKELSQQPFDVIISDMGRPPDLRAGYTLLHQLRSRGDQTPFVIYSSSTDPNHVAESRSRSALGCTNNLYELTEMVVSALRSVKSNPEVKQDNAGLRESQRPIPSSVKPVQVFISYAYEDKAFYNQLIKHLNVLRQERVIAAWHDRCTLHKEESNHQIDPFLESADIVLFLVSSDFLTSLYWQLEVARALERHDAGEARVIPIILRPVNWSSMSLSRLQALPKDAKPITQWGNRDEAFLDVLQGIRKVAEQMMERSPPIIPKHRKNR